MLALNELWRLGWTKAELAQLGAELGSDVPFFFDAPAAWCTGRGEVVTPVTLGRPLDFVLVCPPVGLSTADVYREVAVPRAADRRNAAAAGGGGRVSVEAIGRGSSTACKSRPSDCARRWPSAGSTGWQTHAARRAG